MKKLFAALVALMLAMCLCAGCRCGGNAEEGRHAQHRNQERVRAYDALLHPDGCRRGLLLFMAGI